MKQIFCIILLILTANSILRAEEEKPVFYYGLHAGVNLNNHNADFRTLPGYPNCCPKFESGSGSGLSFGALFEYPVVSYLNIALRVGYSQLDGTMKVTQKIGNTEIRSTVFPNETSDITDAVSEYQIKSQVGIIGIEPGVVFIPTNNLDIFVGLRFGIGAGQSFDQKETLVSPSGVVFKESGTKSRNEFTGQSIPDFKSLLIHGMVGAGYEFPIGKFSRVVPNIRYFVPFGDISSVTWSISNLELGAELKLAYVPKKEIPRIKETETIRDTVIVKVPVDSPAETVLISKNEDVQDIPYEDHITEKHTITEKYEKRMPEAAYMNLSLEASGIDRDGVKTKNPQIVIEELETGESFPLLPYVFFGENSSDLSRTSLRGVEHPEEFNIDSLPWNTLEIYSELLNIVGSRMKKFPKASLTVTGTNNNTGKESANLELSKQRAEAVKNYLATKWGIDPVRIKTEAKNLPQNQANNDRPEGMEENRRAELSSDNFEILKPVALSEIQRIANPPVVEIVPRIDANSAIKDWKLDITQKQNTVRNYSGTTKPAVINWKIEQEPLPRLDSSLKITFAAESENGVQKDTSINLKLTQLTIKKKRYEMKDDKIVERYSLIVFDYNKADLTQNHLKILNEIKKSIKPDSKILVQGYADRTGEKEYNRDLAARRTQEVIKALSLDPSKVIVQNVGSDDLLYDNSTPQGRNYSRTVKITVETPVKN